MVSLSDDVLLRLAIVTSHAKHPDDVFCRNFRLGDEEVLQTLIHRVYRAYRTQKELGETPDFKEIVDTVVHSHKPTYEGERKFFASVISLYTHLRRKAKADPSKVCVSLEALHEYDRLFSKT